MNTQENTTIGGRRATAGAIAAEDGDRFEASQRTDRVREDLQDEQARLKAAKAAGSDDVVALQTRVDEAQLELDAAEAFEDAISGAQ